MASPGFLHALPVPVALFFRNCIVFGLPVHKNVPEIVTCPKILSSSSSTSMLPTKVAAVFPRDTRGIPMSAGQHSVLLQFDLCLLWDEQTQLRSTPACNLVKRAVLTYSSEFALGNASRAGAVSDFLYTLMRPQLARTVNHKYGDLVLGLVTAGGQVGVQVLMMMFVPGCVLMVVGVILVPFPCIGPHIA